MLATVKQNCGVDGSLRAASATTENYYRISGNFHYQMLACFSVFSDKRCCCISNICCVLVHF